LRVVRLLGIEAQVFRLFDWFRRLMEKGK